MAKKVRWLARFSGMLSSTLSLIYIIVQSLNKPEDAPLDLLILFAIAINGVLIAWYHERIGAGVLIVTSIALGLAIYFYAPYYSMVGAVFYAVPFFVPGVLFGISSYHRP
jgi:apolipoprotein N-acyltransferase